MTRRLVLPRLYPILDASLLQHAGLSLEDFARDLYAAGIRFLQYRDKDASDELLLERAVLLRRIFPHEDCRLILNDRAHLFTTTRYEGLHLGQEDLAPAEARALVGNDRLIGLSTHNASQLGTAEQAPVDYLAIGPVFATKSKAVTDPVVDLEGVRQARELTSKPLVAIGGITRANCAEVLAAGADSVAVISDLIPGNGQSIARIVQEFMSLLTQDHRAPTSVR